MFILAALPLVASGFSPPTRFGNNVCFKNDDQRHAITVAFSAKTSDKFAEYRNAIATASLRLEEQLNIQLTLSGEYAYGDDHALDCSSSLYTHNTTTGSLQFTQGGINALFHHQLIMNDETYAGIHIHFLPCTDPTFAGFVSSVDLTCSGAILLWDNAQSDFADTLLHEIGHLLGAEHPDGGGSTSTCTSETKGIMSYCSRQNEENRFFTSDSLQKICSVFQNEASGLKRCVVEAEQHRVVLQPVKTTDNTLILIGFACAGVLFVALMVLLFSRRGGQTFSALL